MLHLQSDSFFYTLGGFNGLIENQKKEKGEAIITTALFAQTTRMTVSGKKSLKKIKRAELNIDR